MQIKINGQTISLAAPEPFLSILRREKIYFPLYCGGRGTCGKCRIRITEGSLPITTEDRQFFSEDELKAGYRLGCRAVITASCAITFEEIQLLCAVGSACRVVSEGTNSEAEYSGGVWCKVR